MGHPRPRSAAALDGRPVTLLGDAAHPMMPTLAQGAAIALEDGFALARNLAQHRDDPARGLVAYEAERRPRASRVVLQAREQFQNNRKNPAPPPLSRDWIFAHDATCRCRSGRLKLPLFDHRPSYDRHAGDGRLPSATTA